MNAELLRAIDLALDGQWDASHRIVQQYDSDRYGQLDPRRVAQDRRRPQQ